MSEVEHRIASAMASTWDQGGHHAPRGWSITCTCGTWRKVGLPGQLAAYDAHDAHRDEVGS